LLSEVQGLKRKLSSKLSFVDDDQAIEEEDDWQVTNHAVCTEMLPIVQ